MLVIKLQGHSEASGLDRYSNPPHVHISTNKQNFLQKEYEGLGKCMINRRPRADMNYTSDGINLTYVVRGFSS